MKEREYILTQVLDCSRADLYLHPQELQGDALKNFQDISRRRLSGEPLQYILGCAEFMGLEFKVDPRVLIPRPETEILVEEALGEVRESKIENGRLMDLGTGSGNIVISLAKNLPHGAFLATDVSATAIELARENSRLNGTQRRIEFLVSDLFSAIDSGESFDMIVSNPPYISRQEMAGLAPEVRREPQLALDGGLDGLALYRRIIKESPDYLKKNGLLIMEMGYNQSRDIQNIFRRSEAFEVERIVNDYRGIERVIITRRMSNV